VTVLLAGIIGALIGLAAILGDASNWYDGVYLSRGGKPEFFLWVFLLAGQLALSTALLIPAQSIARDLYPHSSRNNRFRVLTHTITISCAVVAFVLSTTFFLAPNFHMPVPMLTFRVLILNMVSFFVVLIGAAGGWFIHFALDDDFVTEDQHSIEHFVHLRRHLNRLLWIVGTILGASIIGMACLRNAVITFNDRSSAFPWQYVFIYGAFFSALLALAYMPIHNRALRVGRDLANKLLPMPSMGWTSMAEWRSNRNALEEALGLDLTANSSIRAVAAILTPLVGSLIGLLLQR